VSTTNPPDGTMPDIEIDPRDLRHLADAQMNVELDTGDMILNLGPQHPATHGTLRVVVRLDGERVISADPVIGYMHRGYEKLTEFRTYPQITTLINRIDWLSSFANEVPFIDGAEKLLGVTAPPRAQYIRTMLTELSRIATFVLFLGEMSLQVGGITPAFFGFRDREHILNLIESATGGRFHPNFNRIGGILDDLPWGWLSETRSAMQMVLDSCDDFEDLVANNEIFQARTRSIGIIPGELGASYGVSGSNLRASGRDCAPYLVYPELDFKVWTHPDGDSYARYMVRLQETRESARMVVQMLDQIPEGPIMAKVPRIIKVPEGEVWVETENPLGQMGYYIVSKGGTGPFRVKIRSASFSNVSILPWLLRGVYVPDVITILASLYFILGDIDR
jgi:NADH-quinone oxidoreductase subunit D